MLGTTLALSAVSRSYNDFRISEDCMVALLAFAVTWVIAIYLSGIAQGNCYNHRHCHCRYNLSLDVRRLRFKRTKE